MPSPHVSGAYFRFRSLIFSPPERGEGFGDRLGFEDGLIGLGAKCLLTVVDCWELNHPNQKPV